MHILYVSITVACKLTSLGRTSMYKLIANDQIKAVKVGRRTLVEVESLQQLGII